MRWESDVTFRVSELLSAAAATDRCVCFAIAMMECMESAIAAWLYQ
jgi:hypothetical protein